MQISTTKAIPDELYKTTVIDHIGADIYCLKISGAVSNGQLLASSENGDSRVS